MKDLLFQKLAAALRRLGITLNDVDRLALLRARLNDLRAEEKRVEERLYAKAPKPGTVLQGWLVQVTHVFTSRRRLDPEHAREFLSPQQIRAATRIADVHSLKLSARSSVKQRAAQPEETVRA